MAWDVRCGVCGMGYEKITEAQCPLPTPKGGFRD